MSDPTLAEISVKLDALVFTVELIVARVEKIAATTPVPRISYTREEFAAMTGRSPKTLKHPAQWRAAGGKKIRGRITFSASVVEAARGAKA